MDGPAQDDPAAIQSQFAERLSTLAARCGARAVALGVSGGSDSRAMLEMAAALAPELDLEFHVLTVDHGLRRDSAAEAAAVGARAAALGLPHAVLRWDGAGAATGNLAAAARDARYRLMRDWRRAAGAPALAVAHTQDDVAETFLLRLARGSGVDGLAMMADRVTEAPGLFLIRPLLGASRAGLRAVCRRYGAAWVEDPSNSDLRHDRPKARQILAALAPLGLSAPRLAKTAAQLRRARAALDAQTAALWNAAVSVEGRGLWLRLDPGPLAAAPREIGLGLFAFALRWASGAPYRPRLDSLEAAFDAALSGASPTKRTLHGCVIEAAPNKQIAVMREAAACEAPLALALGEEILWDRRWAVTALEAGLTIRALGEDGLRQMAEKTPPAAGAEAGASAEWTDTPRAAKLSAPSVFSGGRLIAAPGPFWAAAGVKFERIAPELS